MNGGVGTPATVRDQRLTLCTRTGSNESVIDIPDRLRRKAAKSPERRAWLAALPDICSRLSSEWTLRLGSAFEECHVSLVVIADGGLMPAVLKVPMPAEIELGTLPAGARASEADALRVWAGEGAVRLLEHDHATGATLMERCVPGASLDHIGDDRQADRDAAALLEQLHRLPTEHGEFVRLADRARRFTAEMITRYERAGSPFDRRLLDTAVDLLGELISSEPPEVLLHGDFHHHNILAAGRQPWLAIDPLPMIGDPAYDVVQYLLFRKGDLADPGSQWGPVIDRFCSRLEIDAERAKAWSFVRLVGDAVAEYVEEGVSVAALEATQGHLWSARLVQRLRD